MPHTATRTWTQPVSTDQPMADRTVEWWADCPDDAAGVLDAARRLARELHALRQAGAPL